MLASGVLQYSADLMVTAIPSAAVIINNSYPILTYADPKLSDYNLRKYSSHL